MDNRIVDVRIEDRSLDPASAEVWVTVTPGRLTPTTEVRGRLMGPRSPYASTVEIAYPLAPLRRPEPTVPGALRSRVVLPEPSLWSPEGPYLYEGPVELWQDGQRCQRVTLRHGLRQLAVGPRGLRVNGRPLTLSGVACEACFPEQALALRRAGRNALFSPLRPETVPVWDAADRYGFLVLGRLEPDVLSEVAAHLLQALSRRPGCLGWVVGQEWLTDGRLDRLARALEGPGAPPVGVEVGHDAVAALPDSVRFVVCRSESFPALAGTGRPAVVLEPTGTHAGALADAPVVLGHVEAGPAPL